MCLVLPSATISTIIAAVIKAKAADAAAAGDDQNHVATKSQIANDINQSLGYLRTSIGKECKLPPDSPGSGKGRNRQVDLPDALGVLSLSTSSCHPRRQVCVPDGTSSLGGRCHDKETPGFVPHREERRLQLYCSSECPQEFCTCARTASSFADCSYELLESVCATQSISKCFNEYFGEFYQELYCGMAHCYVNGGSYEECQCGYKEGYCDMYESYAESDADVAAMCASAGCCAEAETSEEKMFCITGEAPESSTVEAQTDPPTKSPTKKPTVQPSATPTSAPTDQPTLSPTETPSFSPTKQPTAKPVTGSPTKQPTARPSAEPTDIPTNKPTAMPTDKPSGEPTNTPTKKPTTSPTMRPVEEASVDQCGNLVCEIEETPHSCSSDCDVTTFKTRRDYDASSNGQLFTVRATKDITIFSFDVVGSKVGDSDCFVLTRTGHYHGYEDINNGWQRILNRNVQLVKGGRTNLGALYEEIYIAAGSTQAFYISCDHGILYAKGNSEGAPFDGNGSLVIHEGKAMNKDHKVTSTGQFRGWIRYYSSASGN